MIIRAQSLVSQGLPNTPSAVLIRKHIPIPNHRLGKQPRKRHQHAPHNQQPKRKARPDHQIYALPQERHEEFEQLPRPDQRLELRDVQAGPDAHGERGGVLRGGEDAAVGVD